MTAVVEFAVTFVLWPFIGTRYGQRLTWRHGRTRFGRLVWTTGARCVHGFPLYMPVLGQLPDGAHRCQFETPKPDRRRMAPTSARGGARPSLVPPRRPVRRSPGMAGRTSAQLHP